MAEANGNGKSRSKVWFFVFQLLCLPLLAFLAAWGLVNSCEKSEKMWYNIRES